MASCNGKPFQVRLDAASCATPVARLVCATTSMALTAICPALPGWTGGPYGIGSRFKLRHTRAIIDAIHSGELEAAEYETMPIFGLKVGCC